MNLIPPFHLLTSAPTLSLLSSAILVVLFGYLYGYTRRRYFAGWTMGWLFYNFWMASAPVFPDVGLLVFSHEWIRHSFIGLSAVCLLWGALRFVGREVGVTLLLAGELVVFVGTYLLDRLLHDTRLWPWPVFLLLGGASFFMANGFFRRRIQQRYIGATILVCCFIWWGVLLGVLPHVDGATGWHLLAYSVAAVLQIGISIGMIVLMLEEARGEKASLRVQVRTDAWLAHRLQKEIDVSEGKYRHIFEHASDGIFIVDPRSMQILEVNRAAEALTGYPRDELLQLRFVNLCAFLRDKEKDLADDPSQMQKVFTSYGNMPLQRKDNNMALIEGSASVMESIHGPILHLFLREVTERRRLEQQLRQAEKLSALGQLISGVAHEINNPLAVISGYAQLLAMRSTVDEKTKGDLLKIQRESERASKIVQNFLTFARKHPMEKTNVILNNLVDVALELMDYDFRASGIKLEKEFDAELPQVFADPNQLEQVFLNIINNAVQAMEGSPREKVLKVRTSHTPTHVRLSIADHGPGIPPSILPKIFDPFFTTKEVGSGTGLGLSISYSIVKEHSGNLLAENHSEGGAMFTLELPVSHVRSTPGVQAATPVAEKSVEPQPSRIYRVLVVDDELAIQDVFAELLSDRSCDVSGASNGLDAMKLIERKEFDLLICDLKMPGMDGRRLYEKVKEIKPKLAQSMIFITGDTNSPKTLEFLEKSGNRWLMKPFNFREMVTVVSDCLKAL